jgi:predicted amidohydrolase
VENVADTVRVGACQTPEIIGNPNAALDVMLRFAKEAEENKVDLLLFPECFLTGYILSEAYAAQYSYKLESAQFFEILKKLEHIKPVLVFGLNEKTAGRYYNSAVVVNKGKIVGVYRKTHLINPNELFYTPGNEMPVFEIKGLKYGINICYDTQFPEAAKAVSSQGA